jgi:hypothetical protein
MYDKMLKKMNLEASMRTTLAIREELLEEFKSMPGAKTKREYSDFETISSVVDLEEEKILKD